MVYYGSLSEITNAYQPMVSVFDYMSSAHHPDVQRALQLASLQQGQRVLDVGAGSGRLIAAAKQAVGDGFCLAIDAVQGLLDLDIPWQLSNAGLTVYPLGTSQQQVHLMNANVTDDALRDRIAQVPQAPPSFDCIFALHLLNTIPPDQRLGILRNLYKLLNPDGCLIVSMSARLANFAPSPAESTVPVQFRTSPYTEAPGSLLVMRYMNGPTVPVPRGIDRPLNKVFFAMQLSPTRFWSIAAQQASEAANAAGFVIDRAHQLGKGDCFGLPVLDPSLPASTLVGMSHVQIIHQLLPQNQSGWACRGRTSAIWIPRMVFNWLSMSVAQRDCAIVEVLQEHASTFKRRVDEAVLPGNVIGQAS
ncbi:hypothetical protein PTNB73_01418 [Pyrenophora teres f. teres]|nr:hypothetical protein PTNB85_01413 [Pyrenophora teres f. teres]KAE8854269.1 hypothetical protein HRS9122_01261 [Pyrenophora teres f. teres]KAE8872267.1 hypothetical protein PTNB73_01418 [Pyrenophora teres f. teres]